MFTSPGSYGPTVAWRTFGVVLRTRGRYPSATLGACNSPAMLKNNLFADLGIDGGGTAATMVTVCSYMKYVGNDWHPNLAAVKSVGLDGTAQDPAYGFDDDYTGLVTRAAPWCVGACEVD